MAFDPPNAKKAIYWAKIEVMVVSVQLKRIEAKINVCALKSRNRGILVDFDCVIRNNVKAS